MKNDIKMNTAIFKMVRIVRTVSITTKN
jgi:hypothetical protein